MKKIIDNSVISAIGRNITSVELMPIIQSRYQVVVPEDVVLECKRFEDGRLIPLIESAEVVDDHRVGMISSILKDGHYPLGMGEISCIASALVLTAENVPNYLVLDDRAAVKVARMANGQREIRNVLGKDVSLNITGTVGLILHLNAIGAISDRTRRDIGFDLEGGDFRISNELLSLLR